MASQYSIGIDLGTTNSCLAYVSLSEPEPPVQVLPIPQSTGPDTTENRALLPSFLYLGEKESAGNKLLRWIRGDQNHVVGEWARRQAAEAPMRVVAAAKSWLCHTGVDRRKPILPWNAPADVPKMSPVEATRRYLEHFIQTWDEAYPEALFEDQEVVLTVPASFDASARELTRDAALDAGFPKTFVLLEEPQAAVYAWLADHHHDWRRQVKEGDVLLVCDVGGGTSDFTLISVAQEEGQLTLRRLAVGNHILVGGDNMDLALAQLAQATFQAQGVKVDAWQSVALWHACRTAKETLLGANAPAQYPVAVLGRGRNVVGESMTAELDQARVSGALMDGFFPLCRADERPARRGLSGFKEIGLPFENDPAITRHLAQFLDRQEQAVRPTRVLFNGGVFKSEIFRQRILEVLASWFGSNSAPGILEGNHDFDLAVARGAACYGHTCRRGGIRIRGGTARSYYVGIETSGPAIPGVSRPLHALCVTPRGMEEGTEIDVPGEPLGLVVGEAAHFRFFGSTHRTDPVGTVLTEWTEDDLIETAPMETTLPAAAGNEGYVPVTFHAKVTELGILELWCVSAVSPDRWKLEFSVREDV